MRRRFRSSFRRHRNPSEWFAAAACYGASISLPGMGTPIQVTLMEGSALYRGTGIPGPPAPTGVGQGGTVPGITRFKVLCVRGEIIVQLGNFLPVVGDQVIVNLGIVVDTTAQGSQSVFDPGSYRDAERNWLWLGRYFYLGTPGPIGGIASLVSVGTRTLHVRTKTKRVLRAQDRLSLVASWTSSGTGIYSPVITSYLRTLYSEIV